MPHWFLSLEDAKRKIGEWRSTESEISVLDQY
jgi:hypothetical protein